MVVAAFGLDDEGKVMLEIYNGCCAGDQVSRHAGSCAKSVAWQVHPGALCLDGLLRSRDQAILDLIFSGLQLSDIQQ